MNPTRTGKIARLPKSIRHQLNRRLEDGQPGNQLVVWLNGLPEVRHTLELHFDAHPINEQNLSDWKQAAAANGSSTRNPATSSNALPRRGPTWNRVLT